jgi:hypothetical protein
MHTTDDTPVYLPTDDYNDLAAFRRRQIPPPGAVYLTVDDNIVVNVLNPSQTVGVSLTMRILLPGGEVMPVLYQFPSVAASSSASTKNIPGVEGFLLSATVDAPSAQRGALYVQVSVKRGRGLLDQTSGDLICEGYPGGLYLLSYPPPTRDAPDSSAGLTRSVTVANPAAGADWSVTVPAGVQWVLQRVRAVLTTAAGGGNRTPDLQILDAAANLVLEAPGGANQAGGLTESWVWSTGATTTTTAGSTNMVNLPTNVRLLPNWVVRTVTANLAAGDQWSSIVLSVVEFVAA